jgi:hypothetical protein
MNDLTLSRGSLMRINHSFFQPPLRQLLICALCTMLSLGCGGTAGPQRVSAKGTVHIDSEPLETGSITIRPAEGHSGPAVNGAIVDGKFDIPASEGPVPGPYIVSINLTPEKAARKKTTAKNSSQQPKTNWEIKIDIDSEGLHEDFELSEESK